MCKQIGLFGAVLFWAVQSFSAVNLVSKVVGQAGKHVVTSREVQLNYAMDSVLDHPGKKVDPLPIQSDKFAPELVEVLKDWVVYLETNTFVGGDVKQSDKDKLELATRSIIRKTPFYLSLEFSDKEIRDTVNRKLKVRQFVRFKRNSAAVPVSDAEALKYFNDNIGKFGNVNFNDYKENIKLALNRQLVDKRLQDWFEILLKKYQARSFLQDF